MYGRAASPFSWDMARLLLDGHGNVLHFPAGSYRAHMADERSQEELDLAMYTHRAREIFAKVKAAKGTIKGLSSGEKRLYHKVQKWENEHGI